MGKDIVAQPTADECLEMGFTCACHNLRRAARAVTLVYDAYLDEVGLKATQFIVLAVLSYQKEEPLTVTGLADSLVLEQSSLSRNLAVLERLGWVKLVPGADRRERIVTLTRSGRAALVRAYPVWRRAQAAIAAAIPPAELDAHLRSLRRVTTSALGLKVEKASGRRIRARSAGPGPARKRKPRAKAGTQEANPANVGRAASASDALRDGAAEDPEGANGVAAMTRGHASA